MELKWGKPQCQSAYAHDPMIWVHSLRARAFAFEQWLALVMVDPSTEGDEYWHRLSDIRVHIDAYFFDLALDPPPAAALREGLYAIGTHRTRKRFHGSYDYHTRYGPLVLAV